jgi:uncharacterized protein (TIGR04168 family)
MGTETTRIAVIGDIHLQYDDWDTAYFNRSDYDLLLLTGDLGEFFHPRESFTIAAKLAQLLKPAVFVPGNHDVHNTLQIAAEILRARWLASVSGYYHFEHHERLAAQLNPVAVGGYSIHPYQGEHTTFDLVVARPYAMGGSSISYAPLMRSLYGVKKEAQSIKLLCNLVDLAESENLIFLAHNGPSGLGDGPADIWGCDFDPAQGDFGDQDLQEVVQYAQGKGKRVLAVIAGHMHLQTYLGPKPVWKRRGEPGPERPFCVEKDGVLYVNAARVPRIDTVDGRRLHYHVCIEISGIDVAVREVVVVEEEEEE